MEHALLPGDILRVERRYLVEGVLQTMKDEGRFEGIERVGSSEHIRIRDATSHEVRLLPLHSVAEIVLVKAKRRPKAAPAPTGRAAWDPGVV